MSAGSAEAGAGLLLRGLAAGTEVLPRPSDEELSSAPAEDPPVALPPPEVSAALDDSAFAPPRELPRVAAPFEGALLSADDAAASEPAEPAEPVVSANAIGIAEIADPTPRASASAPTRPT